MSTCSVYGAQDIELDETSPTNPLSAYAESKLAAEKYLENKNSLIFRLGTLFGEGDLFSRIRLDLVVNVLTVTPL
jgi:nucleoside-diphosphate-sugar epimerase